VERTRKRRETDREKGIAEMMALMQERDQILAGHTDFADAMLPARDMADKIVAVQRRLETQLGSKSLADQARRSAVQQHEQIKKQAAGEATARTPAEAAAQLQTQLVEENRDTLLRESRDEPLVGETAPPVTRTLGELVRLDKLFPEGSVVQGAQRLMMTEMSGRLRKLAADTPVRILVNTSSRSGRCEVVASGHGHQGHGVKK
jgi:hypothetical protein